MRSNDDLVIITHRAPIAPLKAASIGTMPVAIEGPEAFAPELWRLFSAIQRVTWAGGVIHLPTCAQVAEGSEPNCVDESDIFLLNCSVSGRKAQTLIAIGAYVLSFEELTRWWTFLPYNSL